MEKGEKDSVSLAVVAALSVVAASLNDDGKDAVVTSGGGDINGGNESMGFDKKGLILDDEYCPRKNPPKETRITQIETCVIETTLLMTDSDVLLSLRGQAAAAVSIKIEESIVALLEVGPLESMLPQWNGVRWNRM